ncbi:MAG: hypothetical protein ACO2PN_03000 [Pyrobaculum sp.]
MDLLRIREEALRRRRGLIRRLRRAEHQRLEAARSSRRNTWPQPTNTTAEVQQPAKLHREAHTATRRGGEIRRVSAPDCLNARWRRLNP